MYYKGGLRGALAAAQRWLGFSELPNTAQHGLNGFDYLYNCAQHRIPHGISMKRLMHDCKHLPQLPTTTAAASSAQQHTLPALSMRLGKQAGHLTPSIVAAQRHFMREGHFASDGSDSPADRLHPRERGSQPGQQHQLYSSSAAADTAAKPVVPPQAGTVAPYNHHVLVQVPPPEDQPSHSDAIWWPAIMERCCTLKYPPHRVAGPGDCGLTLSHRFACGRLLRRLVPSCRAGTQPWCRPLPQWRQRNLTLTAW